jgi:glucose-6-phosphate 1-dehydrogenase
VFRIDHYLGKETVQNMLALRFANQLFEPMWNRNYVSHVQITMAEDIGIGGRAGYYDGIGAARDVIQNHLLQLLALVAMEEPTSFEAGNLRAEKEKVLAAARAPRNLKSTPPAASTRPAGRAASGQGLPGGGRHPPDSQTETYAAFRVDIDNRRWAGVPFYLRAAKRMPRRVTEVALMMRPAPHLPFHLSTTPSSWAPTRWCCASSPTRASRCGSARRCRPPRWRSATSRWTSTTAPASPSRAPRPTSG